MDKETRKQVTIEDGDTFFNDGTGRIYVRRDGWYSYWLIEKPLYKESVIHADAYPIHVDKAIAIALALDYKVIRKDVGITPKEVLAVSIAVNSIFVVSA